MKTKNYYFIYVISLILWIITIGTTNIFFIDNNDFLGASSQLPVFFWISLILYAMTAVLSCRYDNKRLFFLGFILLLLLLFFTYPVIEPGGRHSSSYAVTGISFQITEGVYNSDIYKVPPMKVPYLAYQGYPIFITFLSKIAGISIEELVRYFPSFLAITVSLLVIPFFLKLFEYPGAAFISSLSFAALNYWSLFMIPELLTYSIFPVLILLLYLHYNSSKSVYSILIILILLSINSTHLLAPIIVINFLLFNYLLNLVAHNKSRLNLSLLLLAILVFFLYLIYVGSNFFNSIIPNTLESFESFDALFGSLTVGEAIRPTSIERRISNLLMLFPLAICFIASFLAMANIVYNKKYNKYSFELAYILGVITIFLIPYGNDLNVTRVACFFVVGASFFIGYWFMRFPKMITFLVAVLILAHPFAYNAGTQVSIIPSSELAGIKFFANFTDDESNYFSQGGKSIIDYQDPYRFYRQKHFTLWYPPIREFDINLDFSYLLYSIRDHYGLIYYLGYDPISINMDKIYNSFNKIYSNKNFKIFLRS